MKRKSTPFDFENGRGQKLSGIIDAPVEAPLFHGVFAPCFTCTKESHGAAKICRALAEGGASMLRFDMTGLGGSAGDFAHTNFSTRVRDIVAACRALPTPPVLLIGHSISGTAALSAAKEIPSLRAVATIGSPRDPAYVIEKFERRGDITLKGEMIDINVLGRTVPFRREFLDDMRAHDTAGDTGALKPKLFIFHAPGDDIVSYANAETIRSRAPAHAEVVTLHDEATHLFERRADDAQFVAESLLSWFRAHPL
jgi:putative redox protein